METTQQEQIKNFDKLGVVTFRALEDTFKLIFRDYVETDAPVIHPVMIRGRHGVGKSEFVYWLKDEILKINKVVERRVSQMTEGDLLGLPEKDRQRKVTEFFSMEWFQQACDEPVLLFFDELDRGALEVRQGVFEIADSRKLAGKKLHPKTIIMACTNGSVACGDLYLVNEVDPAELDRWTVFDVEPDLDDWVIWAKRTNPTTGQKNIVREALLCVQEYPELLEQKENIEPRVKYPSRRSWARFSNVLSKNQDVMKKCSGGDKDAFKNMFVLGSGFIGSFAALKFASFVENFNYRLQPKDIFDKFDTEQIQETLKEIQVSDVLDLNEQMLKELEKTKLSSKQSDNLLGYFQWLNSEVAVKFFNLMFEKFRKDANNEVFRANFKVLKESPDVHRFLQRSVENIKLTFNQ